MVPASRYNVDLSRDATQLPDAMSRRFRSDAIPANWARAACRSSTISAAMMSGENIVTVLSNCPVAHIVQNVDELVDLFWFE